MRQWKYILVSVLILLWSGCSGNNTNKTAQPKREVEVGVYVITPKSITLQQELSGRTKATLSAEIRPQVGGIIQARL